jgi:hypothetical protein
MNKADRDKRDQAHFDNSERLRFAELRRPLDERGLHAIVGDWPPEAIRLALHLSQLPVSDRPDITPNDRDWGFAYGIDRILRIGDWRTGGVELLLGHLDMFDTRPTHRELASAAHNLSMVTRDLDFLIIARQEDRERQERRARAKVKPRTEAKPKSPRSIRVTAPPSHVPVVKWCLSQDRSITARDRAFLQSIQTWSTITPRQMKWLRDASLRAGLEWHDLDVLPELPQAPAPITTTTTTAKARSAPTPSGMTRVL